MIKLSDKNATLETKALYQNIEKLRSTGMMFGHQDDLAYGLGWKYQKGRSDVKSVTGVYPAVYGWDIGHLELGDTINLDTVSFLKMKAYIKQVYLSGGVNTLSWHLNNPVNGKTAWDTSNTVSHIIPGGNHNQEYTLWLDKVAVFLNQLRGAKGELIPILFRPYHEHTGSWFWWGERNCTTEEYKALWRFTVDYLRNKKQLHNLIFVYSTSKFTSVQHYLERYPGDGYVDVMGFDTYSKQQEYDYVQTVSKQLADLQEVSVQHHKIPAFTETGNAGIPQANWWTNTLLPLISKYNLSYVLVWRNARMDHFYAPFPGQASEADFKLFYQSPKTIFLDKLSRKHIYQLKSLNNK